MRKLKKARRLAAILILVVGALATYLLRGGFRRFEITPYPVPAARPIERAPTLFQRFRNGLLRAVILF